ncbi:hypothetical protein EIP86_007470 [Pleurotus ostreatoroseus]|nr:hypothetical protein EIP86_007470 [Pleurotus ostreatoroseus]
MTLDVITFSKPMKRDDNQPKGPIFPPPPHSPRLVELKLVRDVWIKARTFVRTRCGALVEYLGGFAQDEDANKSVQTEVSDPVWIPDQGNEKEFGVWKQQTRFNSVITFGCPPTFQSDTMSVKYTLELKVEFPGVGNNVKGRLPIQLVSNMTPSSELLEPHSGNALSSESAPEAPPPYASLNDWDGDLKEKETLL